MSRRTIVIAAVAAALTAGGAIAGAALAGADPGGSGKNSGGRSPFIVDEPNTQAGYKALAPCLVADTRKKGGSLKSGSKRIFAVAGNLSTQGGPAAGCGVPAGASAAAISVTPVTPAATGGLYVYANGASRPASRQVSFTRGQTSTTPVTVPLSSTGRIAITAAGTTNAAITVVGYFREPIAAYIRDDGSIYSRSQQVVSVDHPSTGVYTVTLTHSATRCAAMVMPYTGNVVANGSTNGTVVNIVLHDAGASGTPPIDSNFNLTVTC